MKTKTERIAFDWKHLRIRQIVVDATGRKHVCSVGAKHLRGYSWLNMWRIWKKRGYIFKSYDRDKNVLVMEYRQKVNAEAQAA